MTTVHTSNLKWTQSIQILNKADLPATHTPFNQNDKPHKLRTGNDYESHCVTCTSGNSQIKEMEIDGRAVRLLCHLPPDVSSN